MSPFPVLRRTAARAIDAVRHHGPPGRTRLLLGLLGAVFGLQAADMSTLGATAPLLEAGLGFSHAQIGALASTSAVVGVLATLPVGVLADRVNRVRLLRIVVVLWTVGMVWVGLSSTFAMMLMARAMLGAVAAAAGPIAASLVGDVVAPDERGHVFGRLLLAQLAGTTVGVTVSGEIGGLIGWRWAYWWLAAVGLVIVALLGKATEPRRRSSSDDSSARLPLWRAAGRVLRIKTNLVLIVASAFGYYFFAGVATFGLSYLRTAFGIGQVAAPAILVVLGLAGAAGVLVGGRVADRLVRKKVRAGRVWAVLGAFGGAVVFLVTALVASTLWVTLPLLVAGAALLGAANPPLDAARIDIVPRPLLGRAEAIRSVLRSGADASAPVTFGLLAGSLGMGHTFLLMTAPLVVAFGLGAIALHTYPDDVAAAESGSTSKRASPRANHSADADASLRSAS